MIELKSEKPFPKHETPLNTGDFHFWGIGGTGGMVVQKLMKKQQPLIFPIPGPPGPAF